MLTFSIRWEGGFQNGDIHVQMLIGSREGVSLCT